MDAVRSERAICFASELTSTLTDFSLLSYFPHISSLFLLPWFRTVFRFSETAIQKFCQNCRLGFFRFFSCAKAGNLRGGLVSSSREREMTFGRLLMGSTICKARCRPISRILAAVCWCKFHQKILYTCAVWADLDPDILVWIAERNFACFCPICWFFRVIEMRRIWIGWDQTKRQILDCTLSAAGCHNLRLIRPPWIISPFYPSLPLVWRRLKGAKSGLVPTGGRRDGRGVSGCGGGSCLAPDLLVVKGLPGISIHALLDIRPNVGSWPRTLNPCRRGTSAWGPTLPAFLLLFSALALCPWSGAGGDREQRIRRITKIVKIDKKDEDLCQAWAALLAGNSVLWLLSRHKVYLFASQKSKLN